MALAMVDHPDYGLAITLMRRDPTLTFDGARGLITQWRDAMAFNEGPQHGKDKVRFRLSGPGVALERRAP